MTALSDNIVRTRAEAAAQRVKAAEIRRRALWWLPCFRGLLRLDADALDMGAAELDQMADHWQQLSDDIDRRCFRPGRHEFTFAVVDGAMITDLSLPEF